MLIEYRTTEGELISHIIEHSDYITLRDIDELAMKYFEKTGRMPEGVFLRSDCYSQLIKDLAANMRHVSDGINSGATVQTVALWLTMGHLSVYPVNGAYIPVLVGSADEYKDNDWYEIFERIVLEN